MEVLRGEAPLASAYLGPGAMEAFDLGLGKELDAC